MQNFPFTPEQCQQILALIGTQSKSNFVSNYAVENNLSGIALNAFKSVHSTSWIIDSGATDDMVNSPSFFLHLSSTTSHRTVKLPNGENVPITHIGDVKITPNIILKNVLCVPRFQFNLISIIKLIHDTKC